MKKIESENALFLNFDFFTFGGPFWEVLGASWASLGRLWASKMCSFSWLHCRCGCHVLDQSIWPGGMREAIRRPTAGGAAC